MTGVGFWSNLLGRSVPSVYFRPQVSYIGAGDDLQSMVDGMTVADIWRTQPHVRQVIGFIARNIAQVGLHVFERDDDDSRNRDRTSPLARALANPGDGMSPYDLIFALVGDMALYDRAYWVMGADEETGEPLLRRLPPAWVTVNRKNPWTVESYTVVWENGGVLELPANRVLDFTGYAPAKHQTGSPAIEALKDTILEQLEAAKYRKQSWKRGGRASSVLERPVGAPKWSDGARDAFREDWYAKYTGNGPMAGGTPILEDGMTLKRIEFSAVDQQYVEASKLNLTTVAGAWYVNPTMLGLLDNANYSNVKEFRKALYGDTLGPMLAQIEGRINTFLIAMLGMDPARYYTEFNIAKKMQGSFEEQAAVISTAVGRPWMTADEARARNNMPALGGDAEQLVTPLNVLVGGQASPRDSGEQNRAGGPLPAAKVRHALPAKAGPTDAQRTQVERVLQRFFERQGKSVLSAIGAGGEWWDGERWDRELADDLHRVAHTITAIIGTAEAKRLGYDDGFDPDRTVQYLKTVAGRWASNINRTTKAQLDEEVNDPDGDPSTVFAKADESRSAGVAVMVATFASGFGVVEAGSQLAYDEGVEPTKTWHTGSNPRKSHAAVNGETVPIDQPFSNGCMWPADGPDVDEVAGCNCSVSINF